MFAYNLLILLVIALGIVLCEKMPGKRTNILYLVLISVAMVVLASLRAHTVGIDYDQYANYFAQVSQGGWSFLISEQNGYRVEPGYSLLNYLVSLVSSDVRVFMAVLSVMIAVLTAVVLYRDCPVPWMGVFVFVSFNFFGNSMSFLRQSLAIAVYLFAIRYLKDRRFIPYLLLVLLAMTFHKSIIIMLPIYFLANLPFNWKTISFYSVGAALLAVLTWPIFNFVTQYVYKTYATENGLYFMIGRDWQTAFVPVLVFFVMLGLHKTILKRNPKNVVLLNLSLWSALLYLLTCKHFLYQRFGIMFFTTAVFLIPEMLASLRVDEQQGEVLEKLPELKKIKDKGERKRVLQERRKIQAKTNWHKYYYYYATGAVIFFGVFYYVWFLYSNRINLIPYVTFF